MSFIKRRSALFHSPALAVLCTALLPSRHSHTEQKSKKEQTERKSIVNGEWKQQWQCNSEYAIRCLTPKTRRTACERRRRRRSTHQTFWRRQTGFDTAHLLLYCAVHIAKFIAFQ